MADLKEVTEFFDSWEKHVAKYDDMVKDLKQMQSEIDQSIADTLHYIEFNDLNARDGYKAYKKLHDQRKTRRTINNYVYPEEMISESMAHVVPTVSAIVTSRNDMRYNVRIKNDASYDKAFASYQDAAKWLKNESFSAITFGNTDLTTMANEIKRRACSLSTCEKSKSYGSYYWMAEDDRICCRKIVKEQI